MKKIISIWAITLVIAGSVFSSCQTSAEKEKAAVEKVDEAKQELKEERVEAAKENAKLASAEEWKAFRDETMLKIAENDKRIASLKVKLNNPGKVLDPMYKDKIEALELRNKKLRERMDTYEKSQSDWETFKREFNHDMDELGTALKDFSVDNKK